MRIITVSDLHIGRPGWKSFGVETAQSVTAEAADVLYFGGDLAEADKDHPHRGWKDFERGLAILAASPAATKLFTLGNHDLAQLRDAQLTEHYAEMRARVHTYGFHLLDDAPHIVEDVAFVGNVGWYDGTLWSQYEGTVSESEESKEAAYPNDLDGVREASRRYFSEKEFPGRLPDGLTPVGFYEHCSQRLTAHLDAVHADDRVEAVVLGIHYVPSKDFVKGDNPKFAYYNWYMGAAGHADHYKRDKVILGFTGHTHRSEKFQVGRLEVHNLSGKSQPGCFELNRAPDGNYVATEMASVQHTY